MARRKNNDDSGNPVIEDDDVPDMVMSDVSVELTEEEKLELEKEARAEVMKQLKAAQSKRFKLAAKQRIQAEMLFRSAKDSKGEDLITVELSLASHPKFLILDGAVYHSGRKYKVARGVAAVLLDQMHRGWEQEYARISPEQRGNLKQQRNFVLKQQHDGQYGLQQVS